jgi:hypothetical protein
VWDTTLDEIAEKIRDGDLRWMGRAEARAYIRRRLRWRVLDRARAERRARAPRRVSRRERDGLQLICEILRPLGNGPASAGVTSPAASSRPRRVDVLGNIHVIAHLRAKAAGKPALVDVLDAAEPWLRMQFAAALPEDVDPDGMTWSELAAAVLPERLRISKQKRSAHIMKMLAISRNQYDLRVQRLKGL